MKFLIEFIFNQFIFLNNLNQSFFLIFLRSKSKLLYQEFLFLILTSFDHFADYQFRYSKYSKKQFSCRINWQMNELFEWEFVLFLRATNSTVRSADYDLKRRWIWFLFETEKEFSPYVVWDSRFLLDVVVSMFQSLAHSIFLKEQFRVVNSLLSKFKKLYEFEKKSSAYYYVF